MAIKQRLLLLAIPLILCQTPAGSHVKTGADRLVAGQLARLSGKKVGLITNQTGRLSNGEALLDALLREGIQVSALFAPEHGIFGTQEPGDAVPETSDVRSRIPVYSLYGSTRKPTAAMLAEVDLIIYDLQDVGARFYTYISTMGLAIEAAALYGIPMIILDRPNPLGGNRVEGPIIEDSLRSFVGMYPIPVVYGLTCGELALMIVGEGWIKTDLRPEVTVVPMEGWTRDMLWDDTGLSWISPSPNIPTPATTLVYPATCYLEATQFSEGRGTSEPFAIFGSPLVRSEFLVECLESAELPGVSFSPAMFTPVASKHKGFLCGGARIQVDDPDAYQAVRSGMTVLQTILKLFPEQIRLNRNSLLRLLGSTAAFEGLVSGVIPTDILEQSRSALEEFRLRSLPYRLYQ